MSQLEEHLALLPSDACVLWSGYRNTEGYGRVRYQGSPPLLAHRVVFELVRGPIPKGLTLDHLCRNRACVNPEHLEPVTLRLNILRGESPSARHAAKTKCKNGHPLVGDNVRIETSKAYGLERRCRVCQREYDKRRYYANKARTGQTRWVVR